jgi:hypothetical protein
MGVGATCCSTAYGTEWEVPGRCRQHGVFCLRQRIGLKHLPTRKMPSEGQRWLEHPRTCSALRHPLSPRHAPFLATPRTRMRLLATSTLEAVSFALEGMLQRIIGTEGSAGMAAHPLEESRHRPRLQDLPSPGSSPASASRPSPSGACLSATTTSRPMTLPIAHQATGGSKASPQSVTALMMTEAHVPSDRRPAPSALLHRLRRIGTRRLPHAPMANAMTPCAGERSPDRQNGPWGMPGIHSATVCGEFRRYFEGIIAKPL